MMVFELFIVSDKQSKPLIPSHKGFSNATCPKDGSTNNKNNNGIIGRRICCGIRVNDKFFIIITSAWTKIIKRLTGAKAAKENFIGGGVI